MLNKEKLQSQRKRNTLLVGLFFLGGVTLNYPLLSGKEAKISYTFYCFQIPNKKPCGIQSYKRSIAHLFEQERENFLFNSFTRKVAFRSSNSIAPSIGLIGSSLLILATFLSSRLTKEQSQKLFDELELLRSGAVKRKQDSALETRLNNFKNRQSELVSQEILERQSMAEIDSLKGFEELQLEQIQAQLHGEKELKLRDLELSEIEKQFLQNQIEISQLKKKLEPKKEPTDSTPQSKKELAKELIAALKTHEDGWLNAIASSSKPIWVTGSQGSGKTNFATALALVRKFCFDAPIYEIIDRHYAGENSKLWGLLKPELTAQSPEEIAESLDRACSRWIDRIKSSPKQSQQLIVDEYTNLIDLIGDPAINFFKASLSDTRKAKELLIGISHNLTNSSLAKGTNQARLSGTIQIEKFSADGEIPLPRIRIKNGLVDTQGNQLVDVEKTLPSWFEANKLADFLNGKGTIAD